MSPSRPPFPPLHVNFPPSLPSRTRRLRALAPSGTCDYLSLVTTIGLIKLSLLGLISHNIRSLLANIRREAYQDKEDAQDMATSLSLQIERILWRDRNLYRAKIYSRRCVGLFLTLLGRF